MDPSSLPPELQAEMARLQNENRDLREMLHALLREEFYIDKSEVLSLVNAKPTLHEFLDDLERREVG